MMNVSHATREVSTKPDQDQTAFALAEAPSVTGRDLMALIQHVEVGGLGLLESDFGWELITTIFASPAFPAELARFYAAHPSWRLRERLAVASRLPDDVMLDLAGAPEVRVRAALAGRKDLSTAAAERLSTHPRDPG